MKPRPQKKSPRKVDGATLPLATGSAFEQRVLAAMGTDWTTAGILAAKLWPETHHPVPWSRRSAKWQRMGAVLHGMDGRGLVIKRITDSNQNQWKRATPNTDSQDANCKTPP